MNFCVSDLDILLRHNPDLGLCDLPFVPGFEVAGQVTQVGSQVEGFSPGDAIVGMLDHISPLPLRPLLICKYFLALVPLGQEGGYQTELIVDSFYAGKGTMKGSSMFGTETALVHKPASVSWEEAASCLLGGVRALTALQLLTRSLPGESVLVLQSERWEQQLLIQLALDRGLFVLALVPSHEEDIERHNHSSIEYIEWEGEEDLFQQIMFFTSGLGVDLLVDAPPPLPGHSINNLSCSFLLRCLAPFGTWITSQALQVG